MENRNIIIIVVVVIVVLAVVAGVMFLQSGHAKEPTKLKITSDKEQYKGGKLSIKLADLNGTPVSKEVVNVTVTDKKGKVVVDDVVKTDSKGKAKLDLKLKKGKYNVNVSYGGNENYTGDNATQKLKIKEKKKVFETTDTSSSNNEPKQVDYNSRNSDYYKSDVDGSYHKKQEGGKYVYEKDAITGEWSYWADKS